MRLDHIHLVASFEIDEMRVLFAGVTHSRGA